VTINTPNGDGPDGYQSALRARGIPSAVVDGVVVHPLDVATGALAGSQVQVGVEVSELAPWPAQPPHWIHLPASVTFAATNQQASAVAGWSRHSRQLDRWGSMPDPVDEWFAHLRGVLGDAA
jgi:hypothetical protein